MKPNYGCITVALLDNYIIDYSLVNEFDNKKIEQSLVLPIKKDNYFTKIAISDNSKIDEDFFQNQVIKEINASKNDILFCISDFEIKLKLYKIATTCMDEDEESHMQGYLEILLFFAVNKKCSDIHIESEESSLKIRFRRDGVLKTFFNYDKRFYPIISSIIKLISNLDITQKREPQNGRFEKTIKNKKIDFRVSTMPTIYGESIVIRVLDNTNTNKDLKSLGFESLNLKKIEKSIKKSNGLILVTGPTGSGKTTTLYSILNELNDNTKKIITIEDPVEYQIKGIQQVSINNEIGLKFNDVLKNVLRQDPDIIMIGEIRDKESLSIAIQASLTGHLVFSTLHTNDSISTLNRLFDLDAKPYLIASTLRAIIAQRLVLKLCEECSDGCIKCNFTKFNGRISIFEILEIDEKISTLINKKVSNKEILISAKERGFKTILEDAKDKVNLGLTTIDEVYKVIY